MSKFFGVVIGGVIVVALVCFLGWLFSFKGTDSGEVCVVREGGPFDGRAIKEVRPPGEGPKPIGALNKQTCLPVTERDSNGVVDEESFPTKDSIQMIVSGQALWTLTSDPDKIKEFYTKYGRRKWGGEDIGSETGFQNFQKERIAKVILDAQREVMGTYNAVDLNNLAQYISNPEAVAKGKIKEVSNSQNLAEAQAAIAKRIDSGLTQAFKGDFFENVRYVNFRATFEDGVTEKITEAQSLRTEAANAKLKADRDVAAAEGAADTATAKATGARRAAFQQNKAYRANPTQAQIDKIKAFCGEEGCNPQVIGGNVNDVIAGLGGK